MALGPITPNSGIIPTLGVENTLNTRAPSLVPQSLQPTNLTTNPLTATTTINSPLTPASNPLQDNTQSGPLEDFLDRSFFAGQAQQAPSIGEQNFAAQAIQGQATQFDALANTIDTINNIGAQVNTVA